MKCPFCSELDSKVIDSRPADEGNVIRRRRECTGCIRRFTTYEKVESIPLMVIKKDSTVEPFNRDKIISGVLKACEKRPVSIDKIESMVDEIEVKVCNSLIREITSKQLGEIVMEKLRDVDEIAYVRFASVYRQFKDINTFINELQILLDHQKR